jgi:uncharacterized protein
MQPTSIRTSIRMIIDASMRTTITLDPEAEALVKKAMKERDVSFKQVVNEAIVPQSWLAAAGTGQPADSQHGSAASESRQGHATGGRARGHRAPPKDGHGQVRLVDSSVLIYADNIDADHRQVSRAWLSHALAAAETLIVPWLNVVTYLRMSTSPDIHRMPNSISESLAFIRAVLDSPVVISGTPDHRHLERVAELIAATGRGGNLLNDAHLGALALQYEATVVSFDNDFSRFPCVRWESPQLSR